MRTARAFVLCLLPSIASAQTVQPVQVLHEFTTSPSMPAGALVQVPDGSFYGVTDDAIYRVATDGQVTVAARLTGTIGASGALVRGPDGALYGTTQWGGDTGQGTVFRFDPGTGAVRIVHTFTGVHEGTSPFGGLAVAGGQLYGVTNTTLFRLDPASGAIVILYTFTAATFWPSSGLTAGADGLLYGTTRFGGLTAAGLGTLYRLDPATGAVTVLLEFTDLQEPDGRLLLGADGRLYGGTLRQKAAFPPSGNPGGVYRYDPATNAFEVLVRYTDVPGPPTAPGPLVQVPDGSLYGTTTTADQENPVTSLLCVLFRLRPVSGGYVYEHLRTFDFASTGLSLRAELTLGADGLVYGYAQEGGPQGAGTVYRFNPAGGGPAGNPIAFSVLHDFAASSTWVPSEPIQSLGIPLYGTTSRPRRGAIYELNPATGAVVIKDAIPEAQKSLLPTSVAVNSPLAVGPSGLLYGTTSVTPDSGGPGSGPDTAVIQYSPTTNLTLRRVNAQVPVSLTAYVDSPMVHAPSAADSSLGDMYFVRDRTVYRFNNDANTLVPAGSGPDPGTLGSSRATRLVRATDGQIYVGISTTVRFTLSPLAAQTTARIFRVNPATDTLDLVIDFGTSFAMSSLAPAPNGALYVGASSGVTTGGSEFHRLDPATGVHTSVCYSSVRGLEFMTPIVNGWIVGVANDLGVQRLLVCDPATRAVDVRTLPATVGPIVGGLVESGGGLLYAATFEPPVSRAPGTPSPAPRHPGGALIRFSLLVSVSGLDQDGDTLPTEWETRYGLDPFDATGDDGVNGDPDGDGRSNAQELIDGTHPRGQRTRYFAEGATGPFFHTRIDLANPAVGRGASVLLRFLTDTGTLVLFDAAVAPGSHRAIDVATIPQLANTTFSTVVESDLPVAVDRTMSWDASGYGSHVETGVVAPSTSWYLAEGSTSGPFSLFYLLQNPQATAVTATVRYLRPSGLPIERTYTLAPNSRTTIVVDGEGAELASTDVSAAITASAPIVAERAMYYSQPDQPFAAGHESAGVTAPALEWFLAEGATGAFFDLFVLIANPNPSPAAVEVEYLLAGGGSLTKAYAVPANARFTIWVDDEQLPAGSGTKPLADAAVSMIVRSVNGVPIVVERTMWWPGPALTATYWYEAHNSPGTTATATRWLVAGADVGGAADAQSYVLIANPGTTAGRALVTFLTESGRVSPQLYDLPAKSRTNVPVLTSQFGPASRVVSVLVESLGTSPVPIVVEHATYSSPGGVLWGSGGNALAAPLP